MRSRRRSSKGGVQAEKQQRYVQLIAQGINNTQACRIVGINRKTGNRWRYGRSIRNSVGERMHYPPVKIEEHRPWNPRYLSGDERVMIGDLLAAGDGVRAIARKLGRAASTISRELRRNGGKDGRYRPHHREQAAGPRVQAAEATDRFRRCAGQGSLRAARKALESGAARARAPGAVRRRAGTMVVGSGEEWNRIWR
jgi:IS30 family transposase